MYIIIVGGGKIGYQLTKKLFPEKNTVVIIEKDRERCLTIAKNLGILIINGDGCDSRYLNEAGVEKAEVVAATTGIDEDNLIICQLAKEVFKVPRTIARVNDPENEKLFYKLGVDVPVNSTNLIAKIIEEELTFEDIFSLMNFRRGKLTIVRLNLLITSPVINKKISEIGLPPDCVIVSVIREGKLIIPKGNTVLKEKDDLIVITSLEKEQDLLSFLIGQKGK